MNAVIISCGTELVTGQCVDTNSAWIAERLTSRGVRVIEHLTVDDDVQHVAAAVRRGLAAGELVVLTGGLGPTPDDVTRDGIAEALQAPLDESSEAREQIRAFFARWRRPMPESNRRQALVPRGCGVIPNPRGTAPGIGYVHGDRRLYAFPGIPAEMKAMFEAEVVPLLASIRSGARTESARLLCFGLSEARLGEVLHDVMQRGRNPSVGTTASQAILSVRILASADDEAAARRLLEADVAEVRKRLGDVVFGEAEETLQSAVAALLQSRRKTVATAESCTGGMLAKRLTDIPGSSAYFLRGYVTYSNAAKTELLGVSPGLLDAHGAVSEEVARAMADGCRRAARTDYALAITGIAGPGGGHPPDKPLGLVYVALADDSGAQVTRVALGEHLTRGEIRDRACKSALNLLRLRLGGGGTLS